MSSPDYTDYKCNMAWRRIMSYKSFLLPSLLFILVIWDKPRPIVRQSSVGKFTVYLRYMFAAAKQENL